MARPRKTTNILKLKGAFKEHPSRGVARANEPQPTDDLGPPPDHLVAAVRACWLEIVSVAHEGSLCYSDRLAIEHGAHLLAQLRAENWRTNPAILLRFEGFLGRLGLTPSDRSRISVIPKHIPSAIDEFAVRG